MLASLFGGCLIYCSCVLGVPMISAVCLYSFGQCNFFNQHNLDWISECPVSGFIVLYITIEIESCLCSRYHSLTITFAFLQEFKVTVLPILPWQPEEDLSWWLVDLCRGPRCGWHGDSVKREPQTAVHVHKQAASDCPRRHLQCLWFTHKMTATPPRRPWASAQCPVPVNLMPPCSPFSCFTQAFGSAWTDLEPQAFRWCFRNLFSACMHP